MIPIMRSIALKMATTSIIVPLLSGRFWRTNEYAYGKYYYSNPANRNLEDNRQRPDPSRDEDSSKENFGKTNERFGNQVAAVGCNQGRSLANKYHGSQD